MPSWLCNVRRMATEDWLTAVQCRPVGTDGTIKGSPSPVHASEHLFFTCTSPLAALSAHINCLPIDLCLRVRERVASFESVPGSDGAVLRHVLATADENKWTIGYLWTIGCLLTFIGTEMGALVGHCSWNPQRI